MCLRKYSMLDTTKLYELCMSAESNVVEMKNHTNYINISGNICTSFFIIYIILLGTIVKFLRIISFYIRVGYIKNNCKKCLSPEPMV